MRHVTPYPWGFSALEIDRDLAQQSKFGLRRATGIMPDGTPFDMPADSPLPPPIDVPESAAKQIAVALHAGGGGRTPARSTTARRKAPAAIVPRPRC